MADVHLSKRAKRAAEGGNGAPPEYTAVQAFHTHADVDADTNALHHTVGSQPAQAAPGDHTHDGGSSNPILAGTTISGVRGTSAYQLSLEQALIRLGAASTASG